jgi:hypothetical protein
MFIFNQYFCFYSHITKDTIKKIYLIWAAGSVNFLADNSRTDYFIISVAPLKLYLTLDLIAPLYL